MKGGKEKRKNISRLYIMQISHLKSKSNLSAFLWGPYQWWMSKNTTAPSSMQYHHRQATKHFMDWVWWPRAICVSKSIAQVLSIFIQHIWELLGFIHHFLTVLFTIKIFPLFEIFHPFFLSFLFWNFSPFLKISFYSKKPMECFMLFFHQNLL